MSQIFSERIQYQEYTRECLGSAELKAGAKRSAINRGNEATLPCHTFIAFFPLFPLFTLFPEPAFHLLISLVFDDLRCCAYISTARPGSMLTLPF